MTDLKQKLFNSDAYKGPSTIVEIGDCEVEVRVPKFNLLTQKENAKKDGKLDSTKQGVEVLIECVYDPETGQKVFGKHDIERLMGSAAHKGGLLMTLLDAMNGLTRQKGVKEQVKNS